MKKKIILILIGLVPIVYFLLVAKDMPNEVIIHWNASGIADGYGSKYIYLLIAFIPLSLVPIQSLVYKYARTDRNRVLSDRLLSVITFLFSGLAIGLINNATNEVLSISNYIIIIASAFIIYAGNMMNKIDQNSVFGIRLPYTLKNEKVWNRTHYVGGYLFVGTGVITMLSGLIFDSIISIQILAFLIISTAVILFFYSRKLYKAEMAKK